MNRKYDLTHSGHHNHYQLTFINQINFHTFTLIANFSTPRYNMGLFNLFTQEIAIDLGTANILIIHNDVVVVNEPSIIALDRNNPKNVLAVGKKALMMHEKTHESIKTIRPLKDGVIADFNAAELMIREMIKKIYTKKPMFAPGWRMMICIPSSITE